MRGSLKWVYRVEGRRRCVKGRSVTRMVVEKTVVVQMPHHIQREEVLDAERFEAHAERHGCVAANPNPNPMTRT